MKRSLRVLHTADIHLDSDSYGDAAQRAAHRERERRVFEQVVDRALDDEVDLLLIAGDLFDHNRADDETVAFARGELARLRRPVVILPGNHDCLQPNAIYERHDFTAGATNVHVLRRLDGETVELSELNVVVWGRGMAEHDRTFRPLAHIPARDDGRWHLAMAHGFFYEERQAPDRSSPIFADEVRDTGWDYVALGHHHLQADVSQGRVVAWYAGAPGPVVRVDFSEQEGIRAVSRPLA